MHMMQGCPTIIRTPSAETLQVRSPDHLYIVHCILCVLPAGFETLASLEMLLPVHYPQIRRI